MNTEGRSAKRLPVGSLTHSAYSPTRLDMGADAAVYALSLIAVGGSAARKASLARTSGYLQIGWPALAC